jgi:hypothetical protein
MAYPFPTAFNPTPGSRGFAACIGCGCTEEDACFDEATHLPCHWLRLDPAAGKGLCSCCIELEADWDAGDRDFRVPVELDPAAVGRTIPAEALMIPVADRPRVRSFLVSAEEAGGDSA